MLPTEVTFLPYIIPANWSCHSTFYRRRRYAKLSWPWRLLVVWLTKRKGVVMKLSRAYHSWLKWQVKKKLLNYNKVLQNCVLHQLSWSNISLRCLDYCPTCIKWEVFAANRQCCTMQRTIHADCFLQMTKLKITANFKNGYGQHMMRPATSRRWLGPTANSYNTCLEQSVGEDVLTKRSFQMLEAEHYHFSRVIFRYWNAADADYRWCTDKWSQALGSWKVWKENYHTVIDHDGGVTQGCRQRTGFDVRRPYDAVKMLRSTEGLRTTAKSLSDTPKSEKTNRL